MKRRAALPASFIVTVGTIAACKGNAPDFPEITHNPPMPTVTATSEEPDPDPLLPDPDPEQPKMPTGKGQLIREDGQCFWLPAYPEAKDVCPDPEATCNPPPPPMRIPVQCPGEDDSLPEAPADVVVQQRDDGTCFYRKVYSMDCEPGEHCNPPPPRNIDVRCRPSD